MLGTYHSAMPTEQMLAFIHAELDLFHVDLRTHLGALLFSCLALVGVAVGSIVVSGHPASASREAMKALARVKVLVGWDEYFPLWATHSSTEEKLVEEHRRRMMATRLPTWSSASRSDVFFTVEPPASAADKGQGDSATSVAGNASPCLERWGFYIRRKRGVWCGATCTTDHPLSHTPVVFQGRRSYGFEVQLVDIDPRWAGTIQVGVESRCLAPAEEDAEEYDDDELADEECIMVGAREMETSVEKFTPSVEPPGTMLKPAHELGTQFAFMIHVDVLPPVVQYYVDGVPQYEEVALPRCLRVPEYDEDEWISKVLSSFYGRVELYGVCEGVRMVYENTIPSLPVFSPGIFHLLSREHQQYIAVLMMLNRASDVWALLPREVIFIVCSILMG